MEIGGEAMAEEVWSGLLKSPAGMAPAGKMVKFLLRGFIWRL